MPDLQDIGLEAVDKFITTFNSRDPEVWASSLHFPHVRPSPFGPIRVISTAEEYIRNVDYARLIESGWDHSEWDYKRVLHTGGNKIHVAGQWSRYNLDGNKILSTPIVYIVTKIDGHWGIQSRFGCDFVEDEEITGMESRAFKLLESFSVQLNQGAINTCSEMLNLPFLQIEPAHLGMTELRSDFSLPFVRLDIIAMFAIQTGRHSINLGLELGLESEDGTRREFQTVVNVTERNQHLGIQAISMLDPLEVT